VPHLSSLSGFVARIRSISFCQALAQNYPVEYEGAKKGARFDLIIGKDDVAAELKIVRNSGVFDRTVGQISKYRNEVKRIVVVLIDMAKNPKSDQRGGTETSGDRSRQY
jgi:hypothetical protein